MTETAFDRIIDAFRDHGCKVIDRGNRRADAACPHHDDQNPSVSVTGIDGRVLVWCHGGCDTKDVLAAAGLSLADLYDQRSATYRYDDGRTVRRYYDDHGKKRFMQVGAGKTSTLYHLARLREAPAGSSVFLVEGEADVHAIEAAGGIATTAPQGAKSFHKVDVEPLRGHWVTCVVDRDKAGDEWAAQVAAKLEGVAGKYRFVRAGVGKDASEHIAAGHGLTDFEPYTLPEPELGSAQPRTSASGTTTTGDDAFGSVKLADLLIPRIQGRFRWCKELGWLHFDGTKWRTDAEPAILNELVATIKAYTRETLESRAQGLTRDDLRELQVFSGASTQNQAIKIARGAPQVLTDVAAFDPAPQPGAPWLLPCANGYTVEMYPEGRIKVRRTSPDDLNTHTACAYEPDATAGRITAAFADYQPDTTVRTFMLQQWARGLSGMGSETFTVNLGEQGGNGKGTMQGVLEAVAGDYAVELPVEVILKGNGAAREVYRSELAAVRGARLVFCDEPAEGARYNLGMLKKITGGGTLQGRHMGKDAITFEPRILFQMASNNRPSWAADGGMQRRYIEITWDFQVDPAHLREAFKEEVKAEASGFLNVVLEHWTGAGPLRMPDSVRRQTVTGAAQSSPAAQFVDEALVRKSGARVSSRLMYDAYTEWSRQNGLRPVSSTKLGRELTRLKISKGHGYSGSVYNDVEVLDDYIK